MKWKNEIKWNKNIFGLPKVALMVWVTLSKSLKTFSCYILIETFEYIYIFFLSISPNMLYIELCFPNQDLYHCFGLKVIFVPHCLPAIPLSCLYGPL